MYNACDDKWGKTMENEDAWLSIKTMVKLKPIDTQKEICLVRKL